MPPNSISLQFDKMPTVTVDGQTHKFKADKATGGYEPITEGGVTYSLVKDADSGRYTMSMSGEPAALERYNFSVAKGRVTDGNFGNASMENFFKGSVNVGEKKKDDYFASFSIAGGHLKDRTSFLQSGVWGLDSRSATKELERLEEEAKKDGAAKKNSGAHDPGDQKSEAPGAPKDEGSKSGNAPGNQNLRSSQFTNNINQDPSLIATSNQPLTPGEVKELQGGLHQNVRDSIDILLKANDHTTLREAFTQFKKGHAERAQEILTDQANALLPNQLSNRELARKTEVSLTQLGLKANPTKGDGNCFFHAVADQVGKQQGVVRAQVALAMNDLMTRPKHVRLPQGLDNEPTEELRDNTLLDASKAQSTAESEKAWGEDSHCAYVARAFDRPVVLIAPDRIALYEKDKETHQITESSQLPANAIFLSHKGGNHWESASPIKP